MKNAGKPKTAIQSRRDKRIMNMFLKLLIIFVVVTIIYVIIKNMKKDNNTSGVSVSNDLMSRARVFTPTPSVIFECPGIGKAKYGDTKELFIVDENEKKVVLNQNVYGFDQIKSYRVENEQSTYLADDIQIRQQTTGYKKDTGEVLGRAVGGGVLAGGVGAVIGGVTAESKEKKEYVLTNVGQVERRENDYRIYVNVGDNGTKTEMILLRDDFLQRDKICQELDKIIQASQAQ